MAICNATIIQWANNSLPHIPLVWQTTIFILTLNSVPYLISCAGHLLFVPPPDPLRIIFLPAFCPGTLTWANCINRLPSFRLPFWISQWGTTKNCWWGGKWGQDIYFTDSLPYCVPLQRVTSLRDVSSTWLFLGSVNSSLACLFRPRVVIVQLLLIPGYCTVSGGALLSRTFTFTDSPFVNKSSWKSPSLSVSSLFC